MTTDQASRLHDVAAERAILASAMANPATLVTLTGRLEAADFFDVRHGVLWDALCEMRDRDLPIDPLTVTHHLVGTGAVRAAGGRQYIIELSVDVTVVAQADYYADIVLTYSKYRQYQQIGTRIQQTASSGPNAMDLGELHAQAQNALDKLSAANVENLGLQPIRLLTDSALAVLDNHKDIDVRATGFHDLDKLLGGGLRGGQLVVVAGRPGTGKSTMMMNVAEAMAIDGGRPVAYFSLEMSSDEVLHRIFSSQGRIDLANIRTADMADAEWLRLMATIEKVSDAPLYIDDSVDITMAEIRARSMQLHKALPNGLGGIFIDYLQLTKPARSSDPREQQVSAMSRDSKLTAKLLGVPVVMGAQLNRGPEHRTDKLPGLSDLRESGCLVGDTQLLRADTGTHITMRDLFRNGPGIPLWSVNETTRSLVPNMVTNVWETGSKQVYEITTQSGRAVVASAEHKFLSAQGQWRPVSELHVGGYLAIAAHVPSPATPSASEASWDPQRLLSADTGTIHSALDTRMATHGLVLESDATRERADDILMMLARDGIRGVCVKTETGYQVSIPHPSRRQFQPHGSDLAPDQIMSIEPRGTQPTFDATVENAHNFIANGILAHNSIEQDADIVVLLHSAVASDEDERANETDFILAKHRNGPTGVVPVANLLHRAHFRSLSRADTGPV